MIFGLSLNTCKIHSGRQFIKRKPRQPKATLS